MLVASDAMYIITQYLAKISVMSILLQLTPQRKHNLATWAVGGVCTVWLVASVLLITVDCEANKPWQPAAEHCTGLVCQPISSKLVLQITDSSLLDGGLSLYWTSSPKLHGLRSLLP